MKKITAVSLVLLAPSAFAQELTVVLPHHKAVSYTVEHLRAELPEVEVPWPYQLATIEIIDFESKYSLMMPAGAGADSPEQQGFALFKNQCMRCHSINLQGGDLGPELNVPRNVTEYWSEQNLRAFIKDASGFHARSKMPPFLHLTDEQLDQLVLYLTSMRAQKIPDY